MRHVPAGGGSCGNAGTSFMACLTSRSREAGPDAVRLNDDEICEYDEGKDYSEQATILPVSNPSQGSASKSGKSAVPRTKAAQSNMQDR